MDRIEVLESKISRFLRFGVVSSGIIIFLGWIFNFKFSGNPFYSFDTYDHIPLKNLIEFHIQNKDWSHLISYFGLFILIIIPIIRVLLTVILFFKEKEYLLSAIAIMVFICLILSMSIGASFN